MHTRRIISNRPKMRNADRPALDGVASIYQNRLLCPVITSSNANLNIENIREFAIQSTMRGSKDYLLKQCTR